MKNVVFGVIIGFTGAGGQLILLTNALTEGPAYLIFPIISLSPVITILLSLLLLKERTVRIVWVGIILALIAIPLLSNVERDTTKSENFAWMVFALIIFLAWGVQAYFIKLANKSMQAEEIFLFMTLVGILLIPIALLMTDFSIDINLSFDGMWLASIVHLLNAFGALFLVYALRFGKAIIVSPLTNAVAPLLTVLLSLILYRHIPNSFVIAGMIISVLATFLITIGEELKASNKNTV